MNIDGSFGNWLRERRKALDLTQADLAEQISCSVMTIRKIEAGERRASKQIAERMADILAIPLQDRPVFLTFARRATVRRAVGPLPAIPSTIHDNLPVSLTPFIGRKKELAQISERLNDPACRLLSLVGPGGIGKTRLAIEAAREALTDFAHGVYYVSLGSVGLPDLIVPSMGNALKISFYGSENPNRQIIDYLRDKQVLLVLDNFEHLLEGAGLLTDILENAPFVKILVTSRERLNLQEEWILNTDGLAFPKDQAADGTEAVEHYGAVQLFVQRAQQIQAGFSLVDNVEAVIAICQKVEGMPLCIELAATWLPVMPAPQIAEKMANALDFLVTPLRNVIGRHRNIRAVFEQSWQLLSSKKCDVLAKLSVFRGGWDLEAAEQVAGASLPMLADLLDKTLVRLNAAGRYEMHDLLRQFAADKLLNSSELAATERRHYEYFVNLAEQLEKRLYSPQHVAVLDRLDVEHNNLRAALNWTVCIGDLEAGLRLAGALGWFWRFRQHDNEGAQWLIRLLAAGKATSSSVKAKALHHALQLTSDLDDDDYLAALKQEALALIPAVQDDHLRAWLLVALAWQEDFLSEQREVWFREALSLFQRCADNVGTSSVIGCLGQIAMQRGDFTRAIQLYDEGIRLARQSGNRVVEGDLTFLRGCASYYQGNDFQQTKHFYQQSLVLFEEQQDRTGVQAALLCLGKVALIEADDAQAYIFLRKSLTLGREMLGKWANVSGVIGMAQIFCQRGEPERAAQLLGAVETHVQKLFNGESLLDNDLRQGYECSVSDSRIQMDDRIFSVAWARGQVMTLRQAIGYALDQTMTPEAAEGVLIG